MLTSKSFVASIRCYFLTLLDDRVAISKLPILKCKFTSCLCMRDVPGKRSVDPFYLAWKACA